jgi:hypothetical protein
MVNIPPGSGLSGRFGTSRLADLHPVPVITTRPLATTLPPSSRPHPGIVVSYHVGKAVWEFPSARTRDDSNP